MNKYWVRLINVSLRGATLIIRFFLIFFLAKYLEPQSFALYGIFVATVGYAIYIVGLDFYVYSSRLIVELPPSERGQLLKSQAALSIILHLSFFPVGMLFMLQNNWPSDIIYLFFLILILEHFNQETSRMLIVFSQQITSTVILFIRQASWSILVITLVSLGTPMYSLTAIIALWAVAGCVAAFIGFFKLKQLEIEGWSSPVSFIFIRNGLAVSATYLVATLAVRAVQTFDRYWLEALGGSDILGVYVLLISVAGALITLLDATVFSFAFPKLLKFCEVYNYDAAEREVNLMLLQTIAFIISFIIFTLFTLPYLLSWVGNPLYQEFEHWYPWFISAMALNAIGMVAHYGLYSRGADKQIVYSHVFALIVFFSIIKLFSSALGIEAILIALNCAFGSILLWKWGAYSLIISR